VDNESLLAKSLSQILGTGLNIGQQFAAAEIRKDQFEAQSELLLLQRQLAAAGRPAAATISPNLLIFGGAALLAILLIARG